MVTQVNVPLVVYEYTRPSEPLKYRLPPDNTGVPTVTTTALGEDDGDTDRVGDTDGFRVRVTDGVGLGVGDGTVWLHNRLPLPLYDMILDVPVPTYTFPDESTATAPDALTATDHTIPPLASFTAVRFPLDDATNTRPVEDITGLLRTPPTDAAHFTAGPGVEGPSVVPAPVFWASWLTWAQSDWAAPRGRPHTSNMNHKAAGPRARAGRAAACHEQHEREGHGTNAR